MSLTLKKTVEKFIEEVSRKYTPGFGIEDKSKPKGFYAFLAPLATIFNSKFQTNYITTLFGTVWVPPSFLIRSAPDQLNTIAHETVHEADRKRFGSVLFFLMYMSPQVLAALSLLGILAVWFGPMWLLWLCALVFLAPVPSPGRAYLEMRGYRMNMLFEQYMGWNSTPELARSAAEWYVRQFTERWYWWMWPFRGYVIKKLCDLEGLEQKDPVYREIMAWLRKEQVDRKVF